MESRVYRDKKSSLNLVSAPTVLVVVSGSLPVGGAPVPLGELRFGYLTSADELRNVSVRKEEYLSPAGSPEINTCARARRSPLMSGFWTPAGLS